MDKKQLLTFLQDVQQKLETNTLDRYDLKKLIRFYMSLSVSKKTKHEIQNKQIDQTDEKIEDDDKELGDEYMFNCAMLGWYIYNEIENDTISNITTNN